MKVISGLLKGKSIKGYDIDGTRPTMDRVKESLFAMIQDDIGDSVVLDLFSGSGNLGIEAISNGAKKCFFVDNNIDAIKVIKDNINNLEISDRAMVYLGDWKKMLNELAKNNYKFDIIFVDPPYEYLVYEKILNKVNELNLLNKNGLVVLEHQNIKLDDNYQKLRIYKQRKYGNKSINIYRLID